MKAAGVWAANVGIEKAAAARHNISSSKHRCADIIAKRQRNARVARYRLRYAARASARQIGHIARAAACIFNGGISRRR